MKNPTTRIHTILFFHLLYRLLPIIFLNLIISLFFRNGWFITVGVLLIIMVFNGYILLGSSGFIILKKKTMNSLFRLVITYLNVLGLFRILNIYYYHLFKKQNIVTKEMYIFILFLTVTNAMYLMVLSYMFTNEKSLIMNILQCLLNVSGFIRVVFTFFNRYSSVYYILDNEESTLETPDKPDLKKPAPNTNNWSLIAIQKNNNHYHLPPNSTPKNWLARTSIWLGVLGLGLAGVNAYYMRETAIAQRELAIEAQRTNDRADMDKGLLSPEEYQRKYYPKRGSK